MRSHPVRLHHIPDLRDIFFQGCSQWAGSSPPYSHLPIIISSYKDFIDLPVTRQKAVVGYLVIHPKPDQQSYGHAYSQTEDIQCAVSFVVHQVAPRCLEIISEHGISLNGSPPTNRITRQTESPRHI